MSKDWMLDVIELQQKIQPEFELPKVPQWPSNRHITLSTNMIKEEYQELMDAETLPDLADAATDLIVVTLDYMAFCGIDIRPIWDAIQEANLAKAGAPRRADGKTLKPPGWTHPGIGTLLEKQGWKKP